MSDPRFARLKSDPRFRRLRKKDTKVIVDDRFKEILDTETTKEKGKTGKSITPGTELAFIIFTRSR